MIKLLLKLTGCEKFLADPVSWHMVRGAIMICSMKIISVGFDLDESDTKREPISEKCTDNKSAPAPSDKKSRDKNGVKSRTEKKSGLKTDPDTGKKDMISEDVMSLPGWFEFAGYSILDHF